MVTWSSQNTYLLENHSRLLAEFRNLPLSVEKAQSPDFLNPGKTPVTGVAKHIQWHYSKRLEENKYVVMIGEWYIEMVLQDRMRKRMNTLCSPSDPSCVETWRNHPELTSF